MNRLLLLFLLLASQSFSQSDYLVFLKDKQGSTRVELTQRSLDRRQKNQSQFDDNDISIAPNYLSQLEMVGHVKGESRWLNAVHLKSHLSKEELQAQFDFIHEVKAVNSSTQTKIVKDLNLSSTKSIDYNVADTQIRQIGIDCLHDQGFMGEGVYVAVIDAGFRGMDTISYFDSTFMNGRLLDVKDFVNNSNVFDYSAHGTAVSSCIFASMQNQGAANYSGGAPLVDVALYVSEDVSSESLIEEFNLVQALERCDMQGVDIANISLGYTVFDNPNDDHPYSDMDGNTTIAAQGVNTAFTKGIVVVSAAGNEGPSTISTPCDSDYGLCAAAVNNQGNHAFFSSLGPNADNQVKPDVAATGWDTWIINDAGQIVTANGTSFASPMTAGAVACLIGAHPSSTAGQIIDAVRMSASQYANPDNQIGFGIADMCAADLLLTNTASIQESDKEIQIFPNPVKDKLFIKGLNKGSTLVLCDMSGKILMKLDVVEQNMNIDLSQFSSGIYYLSIDSLTKKLVKN